MTKALNKFVVVGRNIKAHRKANKWTQEDLAKKVGLTSSIVSKMELGTKPVDAFTVIRFSLALGCQYADLLKTDGNKVMFHNIPVTKREWDKIESIICEKGWDLEDFAEKIGVTIMAFYNWNTGRNNASVGTFQKILDGIDIQMSDLVEQEELFTEEEPKKEEPVNRIGRIVSAIDTLIEALEDIRCELCESH